MAFMTLKQMICVVALDRHRHFGRAAEACFLTQPALSMQLRKLERELGVELFDRSRTPVRPTDVGAEVVEQARRVVDEVERVREIAADAAGGGEARGELRLGVIPTIAPYLLPPLLARLRDAHPEVRLQVEEAQTEEVLDRLLRGDLDAGLVATPAGRRGVVEVPLFRERFVAYVARGHRFHRRKRIRVEELRAADVWLLNQGHCFRDQVVSLCGSRSPSEQGIVAGVRFESGNLETLRRMVDHGGGMTLLPELALDGMGREALRQIRPFREPAPGRDVRLIHGRAYLKRRMIEALLGELRRAGPRSAD
jgi:LysR family transcriptional regulator, hydrogen peroxide-inducible genes activator